MEQVNMIDPSELYRPETEAKKRKEEFRNYHEEESTENVHIERVRETYRLMHTNQTYDFVMEKHEKWGQLKKAEMNIMDALDYLNNVVDESDPDVDVPNIYHAYQTAERIRERHPDKDWFHLTGLIHDLGKVLALWGEPQWCVVGDTFVVGCDFANSIVYRNTSFKDNKDALNPKFNTKYGIYEENCGLENVFMSWGHDEYMYQVLVGNNTTLPEEGLYMIRFHSFYPWHTGGDYMHLCNNKDKEMLPWVREFNKFDLYSKSDELPDIEALKPYYQSLIDKYMPGTLKW
ncbi:inositol oxygenase-like [Ptychodera flava]|uniref:inositol oxygenase-like n=1 Tax=Ptychodera flava TaxID=63121 RepID=UPI00396A9ED2